MQFAELASLRGSDELGVGFHTAFRQIDTIVFFFLADAESDAADLNVKVSSDNETLVPEENIVIGGDTAHRTMTITPSENSDYYL